MKKKIIWIAFFLLAGIRVAIGASYTLAVQPCWPPEKALVMFSPLANYLSLAINKPFKLVVYDNAAQFHRDISKADLVIQDAYSAYRHKGFAPFTPVAIAINKDGKTTDRGAIIVRKDSPFHKISDLRGRRFLFGSIHNTQKFFCVWILFKENGIDPLKDLSEIAPGGD